MWIVWFVFWNYGFHFVCPLMNKDEACGSFLVGQIEWKRNWFLFWWVRPCSVQFSSLQWLSHGQIFATPWTAACQASLSITNSPRYSNSCVFSPWCYSTTSSPVFCYPSTLKLCQYQDLFQWVRFSHHVAQVLEFQFQNQSFQWIFRTDFL